ncbi:uncharacterized protein ACWYII_035103 isoform 1-T2 [Salvelinus alpinus]
MQDKKNEMTLSEERELEIIRKGLTYIKADAHSDEPHWDTKYPWIQDPSSLPDNRSGVEATFLRTGKQLKKEPEWRIAYTAQVHEMVERRAAKKLTKELIASWKGPVWYVSHLVAAHPHSLTTPVRLVWNSSQKFRGVSMNDLLKGPDVLNPIRAVLLRFRRGVHAALGDIKKMYNSVWLEDLEMHLHRFLWRDTEEGEIEEYAITRVNIGDRPAGCIAQLAMRETGKLPMFTHLEAERRILEEDTYVDDILTSHNDLQKLDQNTKRVEEILKAGGFVLKPWVRSDQSGRQEIVPGEQGAQSSTALILPNQMREGDNKALRVGYLVEEDKLYLMTSINFSKRKNKMRVGQNLLDEEVRGKTPNPLTRRELLSQVASLYDSIGLVTPAKQKGAILVRKVFQEAGGKTLTQDTWAKPLSENLREEAIQFFEEYTRLVQITFHRSLTPVNWIGKPWAITFSDGSDKSYGAVVYLRWETQQGIKVRLVESNAKLTPLDQKGEPVKAEICGAVYAARLRKYVEKHSRIEIERWLHLLDSQTVSGAIQRDSYGYQTFFANRVGEIQKSTSVEDWWWIPGGLNSADIITRGAAPEDLQEDSMWQDGPAFLRQPVKEWPHKSAKEIAAYAKEGINKLRRRAFSAALTRAQVKRNQSDAQQNNPDEPKTRIRRSPAGSAVTKLIDIRKFSSLTRLIRVIAWVWRAATRWKEMLTKNSASDKPKWEDALSTNWRYRAKQAVLTVGECEDALRDLFLAAQEGITFQDTTLNRLAVYRDKEIMSDLPSERITPARPFEYTTVDLFGPYEVKDEVKKKTKLKVWGIVFCCMVSRAIHTDAVSDQSTEGFLLADQNAWRGHYKLARVISVNIDKKGIVRDVHVRTFPSYPVPTVKPAQEKSKKLSTKIPATVLHRDVRRIIVLLPVEEGRA